MSTPTEPNPYAAPEAGGEPAPPVLAPTLSDTPFLPPRGAVIALLLVNAGMSALTILGQAYQIYVINLPDPPMSTLERSDAVNQGLAGLTFFVFVATVVAWGTWVHRAASNLRAMQPHAVFEFTPGSQVWWYFVPFANLVKPLHGMREIWAQTKYAVSDMAAEAPPLNLWWGLWIVGNLLSNVAFRISPSADASMSQSAYFERLSVASVAQILAEGVSIGAAIVAVQIIRKLNEMQTRWAHARAGA